MRASAFTWVTFALFLVAVVSTGCGGEDPDDPGETTSSAPMSWEEASRTNNKACALLDQQKISGAIQLFRDMTQRAPQSETGWVNLGISLLNSEKNDQADRVAAYTECEAVLRRVIRDHPGNPFAPYTLGILLRHLGRSTGEVVPHFEKALELDPTDADSAYRLGLAYRDLRQFDKAVEMLRRAVRYETHFAGGWYGLQSTLLRMRQREAADEAKQIFQMFNDTKPEVGKKLELKYNSMGRYATAMRVVPPFGPKPTPPPPVAPNFLLDEEASRPTSSSADGWPFGRVLAAGSGIRSFLLDEIVPRLQPGIAVGDVDGDGDGEIYVANGRNAGHLYDIRENKLVDITTEAGLEGDVKSLGGIFADVDHSGSLDLYVYGGGGNTLLLNDGQGNFNVEPGAGGADCVTLSAQILDADHDGDLDILTAGFLALPAASVVANGDMTFPADFAGAPNTLYSNNRPTLYSPEGTKPATRFTDISEKTGIGSLQDRTAKVLAVDFDRDGDADIFEANDGTPNRLLANDRIWRYHDVAKQWGVDDAGPAVSATASDVNQDGRPDIFVMRGGAAGLLLQNATPTGFDPTTSWGQNLPESIHNGLVRFADFDNDGDPDLIAAHPSGTAPVFGVNDGQGGFSMGRRPNDFPDVAVRSMLPVDTNADGLLDVVIGLGGGGVITLLNRTETENNWMALRLFGKEGHTPSDSWSNNFGVGAFVEIAAGSRKFYADFDTSGSHLSNGAPILHIGLGSAEKVDYARIIWPDLVVQSELNLAARKIHDITEVNRKPSSCPVLFKGTGHEDRFDFVTDFLGVGGLGFFVKPGFYGPPDHTETVRVGHLPSRNGRLELRVSEPMEEICYLDELSLLVVRHPRGVKVWPDERMATSGPSPTGKPLFVRREHLPIRVTTRDGHDTTTEVLQSDRIYQKDVHRDRRFVGYLESEQRLEFEFDTAAILADRPGQDASLQLFIEGWVEYPYSHVNFAAWQAGVEGESISVDVRGSDGTWKTIAPMTGYPAGMNRTMSCDITAALQHDIGTLRLRTNLEVFFDRVWLGWDVGAQAATASRILPFDRAELRWLGYPRERSPDGRMPKLYDYALIDQDTDWKTIDGMYTRFGDVRELLAQTDDQYVIMGHGEEIVLEVRADRLEPLGPNEEYTFFLKADGWCKDMDAYTAMPDTVEPLPHHMMGDYPPAAGREYSTSPDHRAWMKRWNTRKIQGTWAGRSRGEAPEPR